MSTYRSAFTGAFTSVSAARAMSCCVPFSNQRTWAITVYVPSSNCSSLVRVERNMPSAAPSSNSPVSAGECVESSLVFLTKGVQKPTFRWHEWMFPCGMLSAG
eukprot:scaffold24755_cov63-Phaeocystis_antarctica.AAC.1